jgi:ribulose kinase
VLLGSAILAATAAGLHEDVYAAMKSMSGARAVVRPRKDAAAFHRAKLRAYQQLHRQQAQRRNAMTRL